MIQPPMNFGALLLKNGQFSVENRVRHSTWRDYRSSMNKHVLPAFKDTPIDTVSNTQTSRTFISNLPCGP